MLNQVARAQTLALLSHPTTSHVPDEITDAMNLDLNLGPAPEAGSESITLTPEPRNINDWMDHDPIDRIREGFRLRSRRWRRWRYSRTSPETPPLQMALSQLIGNSGNVSTLHEGEGSIAAEERTSEIPKTCENNNGFLVDEVSEKKDNEEKGSGNDGSFFDCNICLDFAREPVVTCCGHLFCWPCLYRWLHLHSDAKECPVCKGEVSIKTLTPIYGRGNNIICEPEEDATLKIPSRPHGRRVESLRQTFQNTPFGFPVEEMIRRLGSRFDLTPPRDNTGNPRDTAERTNFLLNRILTSRGMRSEQNPVPPPEGVVDLTESDTANTGAVTRETRRLHSLLLRRQASSPGVNSLSFNTALSSAFEAYFRSRPVVRNQEQSPPVDDRDSFSSIAAVINSESQLDTVAEIDSMVSLSTSSSRRRGDTSRVSDVDSGDSRAPRRRRLN